MTDPGNGRGRHGHHPEPAADTNNINANIKNETGTDVKSGKDATPIVLRHLAVGTVRDAARAYLAAGLSPLRLRPRDRRPLDTNWTTHSPVQSEQDVDLHFDEDSNIGLILGTPSNGLIDVDLDWPQARQLADAVLGDFRMPASGRASSRRSHRWAFCSDPGRVKKWVLLPNEAAALGIDPKEHHACCIVELRGNGGQTMVAPSVHPTGEVVEFADDLPVPHVRWSELERRCALLAVLAVVLRAYPRSSGDRNEVCLALAGTLLRAGCDEAEADDIIESVAALAGDEEAGNRRCAAATARKLVQDEPTTGLPRLCELLGIPVLRPRLQRWLRDACRDGTEDDQHTADGEDDSPAPRKSQATMLVELAEAAGIELFRGLDTMNAYVSATVDGHRETWAIPSRPLRLWLRRLFWLGQGKAPSAQAVQDAIGVLEAKALFSQPPIEHPVGLRLAEHEGAIWLDLCDASWRAIDVRADGWDIVDAPPVRFVRTNGMRPLPAPERGGSIEELRPLLNVPDDDDWRLITAWLVAALRPGFPFTILAVNGEQGSAKSTLCRILRALLDPHETPLRRPPRDERDLMIAATNAWVVGYDNLSGLRADLADALCSLATGGGFAARRLYTDDEEHSCSAMRPIIVNGISDVAQRSDLADRSILVTLPTIPPEKRRTERDLWTRFELQRPRLLGAVLDALSAGLRELRHVHLDRLPRMADFAYFGTALERALGWPAGSFAAAYDDSRATASTAALEASPIAPLILRLLDDVGSWTGIATELLALLGRLSCEEERRSKGWPSNPRAMRSELERAAPNLRAAGIAVELPAKSRRGHGGRRTISLAKVRHQPSPSSPSRPSDLTPSSVAAPKTEAAVAILAMDGAIVTKTVTLAEPDGDGRADPGRGPSPRPARQQPIGGAGCDDGVAGDGGPLPDPRPVPASSHALATLARSARGNGTVEPTGSGA